jgi:hypothetical protein
MEERSRQVEESLSMELRDANEKLAQEQDRTRELQKELKANPTMAQYNTVKDKLETFAVGKQRTRERKRESSFLSPSPSWFRGHWNILRWMLKLLV